ncbi:hypothetical protein DICSQDRAFT_165217 [Dichomitus squalens LYAD-421 SS1]|uniref:uncharacterized protein n=1 Tax=Dichomitus squalens (strain LYAD-421) TaxID=732165 RepID=UPI0004410F4A|nr:uncharacterized protein DICSQDRAFT_165217 [Dichomitus squalens LYAD-421 SS1]EJF67391.1 hypothetical protein DICSQDRAFT_165217 [Dichomitus squalens LYAD-421 SS1]
MPNSQTFQCPHCSHPVSISVLKPSVVGPDIGVSDTAHAAAGSPRIQAAVLGKRKRQEDESPVDQACTSCHDNKKKCSQSLPYKRCLDSGKQSWECRYAPPNERYKRGKKSKGDGRASKRPRVTDDSIITAGMPSLSAHATAYNAVTALPDNPGPVLDLQHIGRDYTSQAADPLLYKSYLDTMTSFNPQVPQLAFPFFDNERGMSGVPVAQTSLAGQTPRSCGVVREANSEAPRSPKGSLPSYNVLGPW